MIPALEGVWSDLARWVVCCPTRNSLCVVWSCLSHERERERESRRGERLGEKIVYL